MWRVFEVLLAAGVAAEVAVLHVRTERRLNWLRLTWTPWFNAIAGKLPDPPPPVQP